MYLCIIYFADAANGAQSLNVTCLFLSCTCLTVAFALSPVIAIVPLTNMYASVCINIVKEHRGVELDLIICVACSSLLFMSLVSVAYY